MKSRNLGNILSVALPLSQISNWWFLAKKHISKLSVLNYLHSNHLDCPINLAPLLTYIFALFPSILHIGHTMKIWKKKLSLHFFPSVVSKAFIIKHKLFQWQRWYFIVCTPFNYPAILCLISVCVQSSRSCVIPSIPKPLSYFLYFSFYVSMPGKICICLLIWFFSFLMFQLMHHVSDQSNTEENCFYSSP